MCLAIPGKISKILDNNFALVDFMGVEKKVAVDLMDDLKIGEYVIVHAGFAINRLDEKSALETIECLRELYGTAG